MTVKVTEVKSGPIKKWLKTTCPVCHWSQFRQVPIGETRTSDITCKGCGAVYSVSWEAEDETD